MVSVWKTLNGIYTARQESYHRVTGNATASSTDLPCPSPFVSIRSLSKDEGHDIDDARKQ